MGGSFMRLASDNSACTVLDDIVVVTVAVDLVVAVGGASADLEAARVEDGGWRTICAGAAGEGVFYLAEAERLAARGRCEDAEDFLAGACVLPVNPSDPVIGLVAVLELLSESDCDLGTRKATEGRDA
jgi:hypothetical protein